MKNHKTAIIAVTAVIVAVLSFAACKLGDPFEPPSYTVAYNANGGSGTIEDSTHIYGQLKSLNANVFTRAGYIFSGWSESPSGALQYTDGQRVKNLTQKSGAVITLYAVWADNTYTVVYHANGGNGTMEKSVFVIGESYDLRDNAFTNSAYIFAGWAVSPTGMAEYANGQNITDLSTTTGDVVTLYAVWARYRVVYDANGGDGTMEGTFVVFGESENLRVNIFTKPADVFTGWAVSESGPVLYTDGQSLNELTTPDGNSLTLYAVWHTGVPGAGLAAQLAWLQTNAQDGDNYALGVNANETINPVTLSYGGRNIALTLIGSGGAVRVVGLSSSGALFTIGGGVTLTLDNNITLQGRSGNDSSLVFVSSGGTLVMNRGARIIGNATGKDGGGVYVSGTFTMNGGEVTGNTGGDFGGGVATYGTFTMNGGLISANISGYGGGGVDVEGTFTMNGGEISANSSASVGGGVVTYGTFIMNGGLISANTANNGGGVDVYSYYSNIDDQYSPGMFIMNGGEIAGNTAYRDGGGVYADGRGTFRLTGGTIYGAGEAAGTRNNANRGAALEKYPDLSPEFPPGIAEYGAFNGGAWIRNGILNPTNNTIRVLNGVLQ